MHIALRAIALSSLIALAACGSGGGQDEIAGNGADPALTSALEDQILVDPNLTQQANPNTVRPPETPVQAQYPAGSASEGGGATTGGGQARVRRSVASTGADPSGNSACGAPFQYGPGWANRLPAEFPAYPGGRVTEAAGSDRGDCHIRVVTFTTSDPHARVLDHYRGLATRAGFSAEHQVRGGDQVLGGVNERTDGAYYLIVTPTEAGSDVALIVNNGR